MALWRTLVLVAGLIGVGGFFAPFLEYRAPDGTLTGTSAFEVVTGTVDVSGLMLQAQKLGLVTAADAAKATETLQAGIYAYRYAMIGVFAPAALVLLIGLVAFARRSIGRAAGIGCIVLGLAAIGVWIYFYREPDPSAQTIGQLGLGIYALATCGLLSIVAGLGAAIWPRRDTSA